MPKLGRMGCISASSSTFGKNVLMTGSRGFGKHLDWDKSIANSSYFRLRTDNSPVDQRQPGRTVESNMESPNPPSTVVPLAVSSIFSRPGPVSGNGEGDFQIALFGNSNASDCQLISQRCQPSAGNLLRSTPTSITGATNSCSSPAPSAVSSHSSRPGVHSRRRNQGVPVSLPCLIPSPIHLYYQNVGGMNSCANTYRLATSDCCYDIIALTETWLNEQTLSSQVICSDYEVLRCDRSPLNSHKSSGGGVLLAVRCGIKVQHITNDAWSSIEQVWAAIKLGNRTLYIYIYMCGLFPSR
ncbi:uncharacterized protein LOC131680810 [Topomyia yanbarensis]|uniref:uncharacterized protein LOC131680810 n=1 Tax=Topomyia yanbarensis TaxID=2498891 RepID=UPI00273AB4A0|nr:uncharacterized protein LOC131680810 [Topomyia yanbarensis]